MTYMALQNELADCRHAYTDMKARAERAEAERDLMADLARANQEELDAERGHHAALVDRTTEALARAEQAEAALANCQHDLADDLANQFVEQLIARVGRAEAALAAQSDAHAVALGE